MTGGSAGAVGGSLHSLRVEPWASTRTMVELDGESKRTDREEISLGLRSELHR